ncbi:Woronin body protein HexA, putative [Penicillium digitatum Pd1]|uniref:Woronin body protein HexA, putative n=1 Tax=Penicillium digitatum (strain Pd1 / CECT 20795) TaxID=1170230 RepID=K9FWR3_PEND1|nr:Woronin body protein HexA, putative [Penicillium digitatum Pd1]EKV12962.1 Woronin body protein HexA, putative [Penicillium digitatum Pd1]
MEPNKIGAKRSQMSFDPKVAMEILPSVNLDFDARVPIPFSVFPSSYRSDAVSETTQIRVEGEVNFDHTSRVEREDTRDSTPLPAPVHGKEEVEFRVQEEHSQYEQQSQQYEHQPSHNYAPEVELTRERYPSHQQSSLEYQDHTQVYDKVVETQIDLTERDYRSRTSPSNDLDVSDDRRYRQPIDSAYGYQSQSLEISNDRTSEPQTDSYKEDDVYLREVQPRARYSTPTQVKVSQSTTSEITSTRKMGYYNDEGQYHSFRRGVERAADRVMHPFSQSEIEETASGEVVAASESVRVVEPRNRGAAAETVPIPCHFVRVGDILILQGRPCQVIRISVSPQTGQHRYLGVDLFTRKLHEESSFIANPSPSVVVQTMLGPVYKTYRILDLRDDNRLVAMTENGDVKQGLNVIPQGHLFKRISEAFSDGRGSVRALVINDGGRELVVDYKVIHGSRL